MKLKHTRHAGRSFFGSNRQVWEILGIRGPMRENHRAAKQGAAEGLHSQNQEKEATRSDREKEGQRE